MRVLFSQGTGSGSITNKENQEENQVRQEHEESVGVSKRKSQETERRLSQGMESVQADEIRSQEETPDVLIRYRDALVQVDLNWKEWFVLAMVTAVTLFILDYQGYW